MARNNMRVKYMFVDLKYSAYIKLQTALITAFIIGSVLCFLYTQDSPTWYLKNGWWLCLLVAGLEFIESLIAVHKAKKKHGPKAC